MEIQEIIWRIGEVRNRANLSARKLSLAIGKNESYINGIEAKREYLPSVEVLLDIIDACNSTPAEFFYHSIEQFKQDNEIIEKLQKATPKIKSLALELLNVK